MTNSIYNQPRVPRIYNVDIPTGHSWTVTGDEPFSFVQVYNKSTSDTVLVKLNQDSNAIWIMEANLSQTIENMGIHVTSIQVLNAASGAGTCHAMVTVGYNGDAPTTSTT